MTRVITGRVVTPDGVIEHGMVRIEAGRIAEVGRAAEAGRAGEAGRAATVSRAAEVGPKEVGPDEAAWIVPGFVDLHVHGGGGHSFTIGDADQARAAAAFHASHGTTTLLASLVTAPESLLREATTAFAPLIEEGVLAGVHYEGPYLSPARAGAQPPDQLRDPDLTELAGLLDLGGVRMVTIAPELPRALDAIRMLRDRGVVAAVGHTDASYEQTLAAITAGATVGTHVCNAMRPVHHRAPGPIVALLDSPDVVCEQIADGVHLHDGMLRHVIRTAGPYRVALVTDAMSATGMPDGTYELGGQDVRVEHGVARLVRGGSIAGSTLTMDAALRRAVHSGVNIVRAVAMAATTPARVLGLGGQTGAIRPGLRADLVLLDDTLHIQEVIRTPPRVGDNLGK